jgi:hypothetical protein
MADEPDEVEFEISEDELTQPKKPEQVEDPVVEAAPEPDKPKRGRPPKKPAEATAEPVQEAPKVVEPDEGLETLKAKLAASETARQAAEQREREASQRAAQAQGQAQTSQFGQVEAAASSIKTMLETQEAQYAQALAEQDYATVAKLQRSIATDSAKLLQLESWIEQNKNRPVPQPQVQEIADPVERLAVQLSSASAQWVRSHPEFATDERKFRALVAAHNLADSEGVPLDTPAYFERVEGLLGIGRVQTNGSAPARQVQPSAAPVSRAPNGAGSPQSNSIRLSADEREMAHANWPDLAPDLAEREYAKQKLIIMRENGTMQ